MNCENRLLANVDPEELGMDAGRLALIDEVITKQLETGDLPGAAVLITRSGCIAKKGAYGLAVETPFHQPMTSETVFDLASLTKALVTAPLTLALLERGVWTLQDPVGRFIPQLEENLARSVTIRHLLTHTSGLPSWADLFAHAQGTDEFLTLFSDRQWPWLSLTSLPGQRVVYSDLGYILLGFAIERVSTQDLDSLFSELFLKPLGMEETCYNPPDTMRSRIAATEVDPKRGGVLIGQVHDENAWAMGGVSGHAGLFSTTGDLAIFAQALMQGGRCASKRVLSSRSVALMTSCQTEGLNDRWGLGWHLQGDEAPAAGDLLTLEAFGHTGFTGTAIWIDPTYQLVVVLLTNCVHPTRARGAGQIDPLRAKVNNLSVASIKHIETSCHTA